jgi:hypothetical protein
MTDAEIVAELKSMAGNSEKEKFWYLIFYLYRSKFETNIWLSRLYKNDPSNVKSGFNS